mmetsp:Transcript_87338/g.232746  ORF Transcript_87338/g.232746 Transcript_87338/m.232746 type:complete len:138 (+) Transcript_87338:1-414(+)
MTETTRRVTTQWWPCNEPLPAPRQFIRRGRRSSEPSFRIFSDVVQLSDSNTENIRYMTPRDSQATATTSRMAGDLSVESANEVLWTAVDEQLVASFFDDFLRLHRTSVDGVKTKLNCVLDHQEIPDEMMLNVPDVNL